MTIFSQRLNQIAANKQVFTQYGRGVERETLRYKADGQIATTPHPESLGSPLTHQWITTDFSESLMEFITPVSHDIPTLLSQLQDIHHYANSKLDQEQLWPLSMPCAVSNEDDIALAQYGSSNSGRMKTLYRQGLKHRYGSLMQVISGLHFNFSFPDTFWDSLFGEQDEQQRQASKSDAYFGLIRNYYRFGWLIPYFFGASPAICKSFLQGRETSLPFENINDTRYLQYATSLRLSDLGYTNNEQSDLKISFNSVEEYLQGLNRAIRTPSANFSKIENDEYGRPKQLNSNVLQIENELYAPIRPKRVARSGEKPSEALERGGVEYIEVRALDVNPFSAVGISERQIHFLDIFLTWCVLSESEPMDDCELNCWKHNWNSVITEGRRKGVSLTIGCDGEKLTLQQWVHSIFDQFEQIAKVMDEANNSSKYQDVCDELRDWIDEPELTLSGKMLEKVKEHGGNGRFGIHLAKAYQQQYHQYNYSVYSEEIMDKEVSDSLDKQQQIEAADTVDFDQYLKEYFAYLK
ncbi:glutamate--cysteine ligase [Vibrio sp. UCD-FRSSP16_10]|uniref:glutamate--cysteine ligase n=1 Tax=unclassified Vibrio TaxID=2614977 RepID=UPI0007FDFD8B|nr:MULTISPECIES: glutamate--cysteine ligase [unclassified Vibrio]OBT17315.1 glutamate--cysteine ligase [Vibrio sp. UCD-FRSSP16_30]OBT23084.1 glutamate--cysteine ligase [Vibrio sp. UCD-FRSSP16_10]